MADLYLLTDGGEWRTRPYLRPDCSFLAQLIGLSTIRHPTLAVRYFAHEIVFESRKVTEEATELVQLGGFR